MDLKKILLPLVTAALLWFVMFSPWTAPLVNFWLTMAFSGVVLTTLATLYGKEWRRDVRVSFNGLLLGVALAVVLWGVFWVGDKLSQSFFDFARPQVDSIYGMKTGENPWLLGVLLLFLIGPAEEIFWRGFVQRQLSGRWNPNVGFVVTTLFYAFVHIWSFNFMLIMSAMVVGAIWGLLYRLYPRQLFALIVSHAVWDVMVFLVFPI